MFEIAIRPRLRQRLRKLLPNNHSKVYSYAEISAIEKYLEMPPMVPVIIILIGTCITFYSGLSSESVERQAPVCAYQTNPLSCTRRTEEFKRIESSQTAGLRLSNESFEAEGPAI